MSNEHVNERLKSLEVANEFHRESLQEISATLKEVVKVQAMLASQREEIVKIAETLEGMTNAIHNHDVKLSEYKIALEDIRKDFDELKKEFDETKIKSDSNARFVKIVTGVVTLIGIPLIISFASKFI